MVNFTCFKTRIGRITNYAGFNGEMVPPGMTALCLEYYCFDDDPLLAQTDEEIADLALTECSKYRFADITKVIDKFVLRLPGADASQNRHNWFNKTRFAFIEELKQFHNLCYVNRPDLDIALAGMEAAEATICGDRTVFDCHIDPTEIGIRSKHKVFGFKSPVAY